MSRNSTTTQPPKRTRSRAPVMWNKPAVVAVVQPPAPRRRRQPRNDRQAGFNADQRGEEAMDRVVTKSITRATLPAMRGQMRPPKNAMNVGSDKRGARVLSKAERKSLQPRLEAYLQLLADPFNASPCKCPVNYNPVPSFMTSVARTTWNSEAIFANPNASTQLSFWPGHGYHSDNDAMDGEAYHARLQTVSAGGTAADYSLGPLAAGATLAAWGTWTVGLAVGQSSMVTNTANSIAMGYDNPLPYSASLGDGSHTRWKLLSMGIEIENTTPLKDRAGDIVIVQPVTQVAAASQNYYSVFPTYRVTQEANTGTCKVSWIPRPVDLSFWHTVPLVEDTASTTTSGAGLYIWTNNNSAIVQTYRFSVVFHWELTGFNLASIGSPTIHQPSDKNIIEPTLDIMKFSEQGARQAPLIAKAVAQGSSPFSDIVSGFASKAAGMLAKAGVEGLEAVLGL